MVPPPEYKVTAAQQTPIVPPPEYKVTAARHTPMVPPPEFKATAVQDPYGQPMPYGATSAQPMPYGAPPAQSMYPQSMPGINLTISRLNDKIILCKTVKALFPLPKQNVQLIS